MICLDTNILIVIEYFRAKQKDETLFYKLVDKYEFAISVITRYEFALGFKDKLHPFLKEILSELIVLDFDSKCSLIAEDIYRDLKKRNQLISALDIFIGATAISNNLKIATLNVDHFKRIKQLELIEY